MSSEKRSQPRLARDGKVYVELRAPGAGGEEGGEILRAECVDASANGLRLKLEQAVRVGSILTIGVELEAMDETLYLAAEVVWCQSQDEGTGYLAGFKLHNAEDTDIEAWGALLEQLQD